MTNNKAQQSAEKTAEQQQVLRDLLALGKKNGRLTLKEMADALSHLELESDDIDKLYETLESMGVEVETEGVLEKALGDGDDDSFEPGTVEEVPEEELIDTSAMAHCRDITKKDMHFNDRTPAPLPSASRQRVTQSRLRSAHSSTRTSRRATARKSVWRRPTSVWSFPSQSAMSAEACCSSTSFRRATSA